jgi:hypothetical protein
LTMKVFRKIADPARYMVVGRDGPRDLAPGLLNTFSTSIFGAAGRRPRAQPGQRA